LIGGRKSLGRIPITVHGSPFSAIDRPTTDVSAPKWRRQSASEMITTIGAESLSSVEAKGRPMAGAARSKSRKFQEIAAPLSDSGVPAPVRSGPQP
jgi:hypothetical protein